VELTAGSTKIKLVYGAEPRVNDETVGGGQSVHVFDGGVLANTGVMITVSLDVGMDLTWDSSTSRHVARRFSTNTKDSHTHTHTPV